MAFIKGEAYIAHLTAWNKNTLGFQSGDEDNITAYILRDDQSLQVANNSGTIEEKGSTGIYALDLNSSETNAETLTIIGVSTTSGVIIRPERIHASVDGSELASDILDEALSGHTTAGTFGEAIKQLRQNAVGKKTVEKVSDTEYTITIYDTDNSTVLITLSVDISGDTYSRTVS